MKEKSLIENYISQDYPNYYMGFRDDLQTKGFRFLGSGSFRAALIRRGIVIKVPINHDGLLDNIMEARAYRQYKSRPTHTGIQLAPCRLLPNGCLMMVYVEPEWRSGTREEYYGDDADWVCQIDSEQVGMHAGRLVAYDYAIDLFERIEWEKELGLKTSWFQTSYRYMSLQKQYGQ